MSYQNAFIQIATDCPVSSGVVPVAKGDSKPMHLIQYELLTQNPYKYTHEDLIYEVHIRHKAFSQEDIESHGDLIRAELFQKKHPCLRASMLPKRYGWGVHYNEEGKIAIYGKQTPEYQRFSARTEEGFTILPAMRNSRKSEKK